MADGDDAMVEEIRPQNANTATTSLTGLDTVSFHLNAIDYFDANTPLPRSMRVLP